MRISPPGRSPRLGGKPLPILLAPRFSPRRHCLVNCPCRLQLIRIDVLRVDPTQYLRRRDFRAVTSRLGRSEIAAVAKHREHISLGGVGKLRVGAGGWAEMTGVTGPVLSMLENVEQMPLWHPCTDLLFELRQPLRLSARGQLFQVRGSVFIDAQFAVCGKTLIDLIGETRQFGLERGGKVDAALGNAESGTIGRQSRFAFRPGKQLSIRAETTKIEAYNDFLDWVCFGGPWSRVVIRWNKKSNSNTPAWSQMRLCSQTSQT
jgi:hypothetical protein